MPFYSDDVVENVRDANDIVDVVGDYVQLKRSGANYFGLCPFHNEKSPSFSVNKEKQIYHCFGCGAGGDVFSFIRAYENMTFPEALSFLAERGGVSLPEIQTSGEERARADKRTSLLEINRKAATYYYKLLRSERGEDAFSYFKDRALSDETMQHFGLGYADKYSDDLYRYLRKKGYNDEILKESGLITYDEKRGSRDKFWNRAIFPIMDQNAKVIAFGGRMLGDGKPKYLNSPETDIFNKSRTLYGLHLAKRSREKYFILCEGYMDVIALHQAGFDSAVASLGTALTEGHASLIKRYVKDVYLSYDSDGAGQKAALRAIPILRDAGIECKVINMTPYKDPDEFIKGLGSEEYKKRINEAENSFMYSVRMLEADYNMSDPGERSRFAEAVAERICRFPEEVERDNYMNAVAAKYAIKPDALEELIRKSAAKSPGEAKKTRQKPSPKSGAKGDITVQRGEVRSQKLILKWLEETPDIFKTVEKYLSPEDFDDGFLKETAEQIYSQLKENGKVNTASIIARLSDEEDIREVSAIFFEEVKGMEEDDAATLHIAVSQAIVSIKCAALARAIESWNESSEYDLQELLKENTRMKALKGKNLF